MKQNNKKDDFLLGNILTGKGVVRAGEGIIRARCGIKDLHLKEILIPRPLTNFEIQKYYQNEPRYNGVYSRDNLPNKIKNQAYVINLDEHSDIGTN